MKNNLQKCRRCGTPLAEIDGNTINILKYNKGKPVKVGIKINFSGNGCFTLKCGNCPDVTQNSFFTLRHSTWRQNKG